MQSLGQFVKEWKKKIETLTESEIRLKPAYSDMRIVLCYCRAREPRNEFCADREFGQIRVQAISNPKFYRAA